MSSRFRHFEKRFDQVWERLPGKTCTGKAGSERNPRLFKPENRKGGVNYQKKSTPPPETKKGRENVHLLE